MRHLSKFILIRLFLFLGCESFALWSVGWIISLFVPADSWFLPLWARVATFSAFMLVCPVVYWGLALSVEKRWPTELDPGRGAVFLAAGAAIGVGLFAIVCFSLTFLRVATLAEAQAAPPLFLALIHFFAGAICEELIFRGVIFRLLEQAFGTLPSLLLSAALFGMAHVANPAASATGAVAVGFESGVLLALAHRATGTLWAPVGLHFGWNFAEGVIFGMSVSGHPSSGLLRMQTSGPEFLTGGNFGPEASVVAVGLCLSMAFVFFRIARRRDRWVGVRLRWRVG